jgi:hypothetical protein
MSSPELLFAIKSLIYQCHFMSLCLTRLTQLRTQCSGNLLAELNAAHSCSRHGVVAARPVGRSCLPFKKGLHSFGHRVPFRSGQETSRCFLYSASPVAPRASNCLAKCRWHCLHSAVVRCLAVQERRKWEFCCVWHGTAN